MFCNKTNVTYLTANHRGSRSRHRVTQRNTILYCSRVFLPVSHSPASLCLMQSFAFLSFFQIYPTSCPPPNVHINNNITMRIITIYYLSMLAVLFMVSCQKSYQVPDDNRVISTDSSNAGLLPKQ